MNCLWMYTGAIGQTVLHDEPARSISSYGVFDKRWREIQNEGIKTE